MYVIEPRVEVDTFNPDRVMTQLEFYGRRSYKSEDRITPTSAYKFLQNIVVNKHESVLEHVTISANFVVNRGISHELVRHRIGVAFTQESTRYVNYGKRYGGITVVRPWWRLPGTPGYTRWEEACKRAEVDYLADLEAGSKPEEARDLLPHAIKTEIQATLNIRAWRHFFELRAARAAHPQMRQVAIPLLLYLREKLPVLFDDIPYDHNVPTEHYAAVVVQNNGTEVQ